MIYSSNNLTHYSAVLAIMPSTKKKSFDSESVLIAPDSIKRCMGLKEVVLISSYLNSNQEFTAAL